MEMANRPPGWAVAALVVAPLVLILAGWAAPEARAQVREVVKPIKIIQLYGRDTLAVGEVETYRVRVNSPYEAAYQWRVVGGQEIGGNPVVYRFDEPGEYQLIATARNPRSSDSDTMTVFVTGKRIPPTRLAANRDPETKNPETARAKAEPESGSTKAASATTVKTAGTGPVKSYKPKAAGLKEGTTGSYTWVIATYFQRPDAEALANAYRAVGFRTSVIVDTGGKGSTVFRVALGRFETEAKALEAKAEVKSQGVPNPLLLELNGV